MFGRTVGVMGYARFRRKPRRRGDVLGVVRHVVGGVKGGPYGKDVPGVIVHLHGPRGGPHRKELQGMERGEVIGVVRLARKARPGDEKSPIRIARPEEIMGTKARLLETGGEPGVYRQATQKERDDARKGGVRGVWRLFRRRKKGRPR